MAMKYKVSLSDLERSELHNIIRKNEHLVVNQRFVNGKRFFPLRSKRKKSVRKV